MKTSRREFLSSTVRAAGGMSAAALLPWEQLIRAKGLVGANDKINLGAIGINGMGWTDVRAMMKVPEINLVAICDVDENVLNRRQGELLEANLRVKRYIEYRKMLEDKDIDVVIIGTPDHWHCLTMVDACAAGKDVYVEKPVGNSIEECQVMVQAQKRYARAVQVGQWQRSVPHFAEALRFVKSGALGKIRTVKAWAYQGWMTNIKNRPDGETPQGVHYDLWLGPATKRPFNPNRFHFNFRWFWDYAGGLMTDWGVHLIDYALLGMEAPNPKSVIASGGKFAYPDGAHETPDTLAAIYEFDGYNMIWEQAQSISNGNYGRDHGISYIGNNGTLVLDRGGWQVIPDEKRMEPLTKKGQAPGVELHTKNFVDVVKSRTFADLACPVDAAAHVAIVCQMGNISYRSGMKVSWNDKQNAFNQEPANEFVKATYHNGYSLPSV